MTKRNEQTQRMAEQYWRKVESGGMAYELAPQTLVVGSFRDGLKSGLAAHRAEILKLERENAALRKELAAIKHQVPSRGMVAYYTTDQLRSMVSTHGLDEAWVETVLNDLKKEAQP